MRLAAIGLILLSLTIGLTAFGQTATPTDTQSKINNQNAEIAKLEAEIAAFKDQLAKTQSQGNTLANAVKEIDLNQKKIEADMKLIEQKNCQEKS